ncbi:CCR4-NOT transcription complex subunit 10-like [Dendronephthya gigantea]|uniref:CCR4-NOT transcription complex subunit 10-like n=1 Tax=Dendronephthya gigantea TaxID=151771 RepID=UPI001069AABD|nr:CCR4-NOT transcription complex subunit 10-like [Dendronephthya gigantea]
MASEGKEEPSEERRGSGTPDFSDQEQDFAQKALQQFEAANYDACLSSLSKLEELRPKDTKVLHNKAVAEFYKSGCERTDDLLKALNGLKKKMNHKNSSDQEANSEALDVEKAVLLYNRAVYCFYVKKYVDSLRNLERLFKIVESLDKNLAQNVCFLLVEVYLITYQTEKATAVLNSLEKLLYDPTKQASENGNEDGIKKPETDIPQPDDEQKLRLHKYKARVHLLQKSIKACKKEIKTIMNVNNMDTEGLFIKSNFEYVRHNERKAVKILNSASKDNQVLKTGESISAMYFNNLGCLHFQMQKYNLASFYFCRAIAENEKALALISADKSNPLNGRPLCTLSLNCRYHLLYNLGVQMLHDGRPLLAFDCLIESVQVYQSNPRLWLRLAECCIMAYHMSIIEEKTVDDSRKSNLVHSVVGSGLFRKVVLETPKEHCNKNT